MTIQQRIKERRLELGLTLKDVAKALGVSEGTVSRYESSDIRNMGIDKIEPLARVLRCSPGYLMGWQTVDGRNAIEPTREEMDFIAKYRTLDGTQQELVMTVLNTSYNQNHKEKDAGSAS